MNNKSNNNKTSTIDYSSGLFIRLKMRFGDKVVSYTIPRYKKNILKYFKHRWTKHKWEQAYLLFRYNKKYRNEGTYTNKKDLDQAFRAFFEVRKEFQND